MVRLSHRIRVLARDVEADTGPSYQDYVDRKKTEREKPLSREDWDTKVNGPHDSSPKPDSRAAPKPSVDDKTKKALADHGVTEKDLPKVKDLFDKAKDSIEESSGEPLSKTHQLQGALQWLSGSGDGDKHPAVAFAHAVSWLVTKFFDVLKFDEFVLGLPESTKRVAETLVRKGQEAKKNDKDQKDKAEAKFQETEKAEKEIGKTYTKYVEWAKGEGKAPLPQKEWEAKIKGDGEKD